MQTLSTYLSEANLVFRQGQQLYHLHQMMKMHPEATVIAEIGRTYHQLGAAPTYAAGLVMGASVVEAYRSTERGERAMQVARESLDAAKAGQSNLGFEGA